MPTGRELLRQAYALAEASKVDAAIKLLERIVRLEPQLVEAWEFYLQLCSTKQQLNQLAKRISSNTELDPEDKRDILRYHQFLLEGREDKNFAPDQKQDRHFLLFVLPAVLICVLIWLSARKLLQYFDISQNLSAVILIIGIIVAYYFLRVMYQQLGYSKKQPTRRYAKSVDRVKLKPVKKRSSKK